MSNETAVFWALVCLPVMSWLPPRCLVGGCHGLSGSGLSVDKAIIALEFGCEFRLQAQNSSQKWQGSGLFDLLPCVTLMGRQYVQWALPHASSAAAGRSKSLPCDRSVHMLCAWSYKVSPLWGLQGQKVVSSPTGPLGRGISG